MDEEDCCCCWSSNRCSVASSSQQSVRVELMKSCCYCWTAEFRHAQLQRRPDRRLICSRLLEAARDAPANAADDAALLPQLPQRMWWIERMLRAERAGAWR